MRKSCMKLPVFNKFIYVFTGDVWDFVANSDGTSPAGVCENREYVDVIIIGAGMAGVSAASTLTAADPSLSYVVLESQNRVGGRMRSVNFGVPQNSWTIEDGANWVLDFNDNPVLAMAEAIQLQAPVNNYGNVQAYYEDVRMLCSIFSIFISIFAKPSLSHSTSRALPSTPLSCNPK